MKKDFFRFRLRTLMLATTLTSVVIGLFCTRAVRQRTAVEAVHNLGGTVTYNEADSNFLQRTIATCLGADFAYSVVLVSLSETTTTDSDLQFLGSLGDLQHLELSRTQISNESLATIGNIRSLKTLELNHAKLVNDDGIALLSNLDNLYHITLWNTGLTDKGLESLAKLPKLETLIAGGTEITDAGTECLKKSESLKKVVFQRTKLGDASLLNLSQINTLKSICLSETEITDAGLVHLYDCNSLVRLAIMDNLGITNEGQKQLLLKLPKIR